MAISLGEINFGLGADTSALERSVKRLQEFGNEVDRAARRVSSGSREVEQALRRQEKLMVDATNRVLNLNQKFRSADYGADSIERANKALDSYIKTLTKPGVNALGVQRATEKLGTTLQNIQRDFNALKPPTFKSAEASVDALTRSLNNAGLKLQSLQQRFNQQSFGAQYAKQAQDAYDKLARTINGTKLKPIDLHSALTTFRSEIMKIEAGYRQMASTANGSMKGVVTSTEAVNRAINSAGLKIQQLQYKFSQKTFGLDLLKQAEEAYRRFATTVNNTKISPVQFSNATTQFRSDIMKLENQFKDMSKSFTSQLKLGGSDGGTGILSKGLEGLYTASLLANGPLSRTGAAINILKDAASSGAAATFAFGAGVAFAGWTASKSFGQMIQAGQELRKVGMQYEVVSDNNIEFSKSLSFIGDLAQRTGQPIGFLADQYAKLSVAGQNIFTGDEIRRQFEAVALAAGKMNLSVEDTEGVFRALQQMMSKGQIYSEELRQQLGDRLPGAVQIMADALGVSTQKLAEMMKEGEVLTKDALPKFIDQLMKVYKVTDGDQIDTYTAAWGRLKSQLTTLWGEMDRGTGATEFASYALNSLAEDAGIVTDALRNFFGTGGQTDLTLKSLEEGLRGNTEGWKDLGEAVQQYIEAEGKIENTESFNTTFQLLDKVKQQYEETATQAGKLQGEIEAASKIQGAGRPSESWFSAQKAELEALLKKLLVFKQELQGLERIGSRQFEAEMKDRKPSMGMSFNPAVDWNKALDVPVQEFGGVLEEINTKYRDAGTAGAAGFEQSIQLINDTAREVLDNLEKAPVAPPHVPTPFMSSTAQPSQNMARPGTIEEAVSSSMAEARRVAIEVVKQNFKDIARAVLGEPQQSFEDVLQELSELIPKTANSNKKANVDYGVDLDQIADEAIYRKMIPPALTEDVAPGIDALNDKLVNLTENMQAWADQSDEAFATTDASQMVQQLQEVGAELDKLQDTADRQLDASQMLNAPNQQERSNIVNWLGEVEKEAGAVKMSMGKLREEQSYLQSKLSLGPDAGNLEQTLQQMAELNSYIEKANQNRQSGESNADINFSAMYSEIQKAIYQLEQLKKVKTDALGGGATQDPAVQNIDRMLEGLKRQADLVKVFKDESAQAFEEVAAKHSQMLEELSNSKTLSEVAAQAQQLGDKMPIDQIEAAAAGITRFDKSLDDLDVMESDQLLNVFQKRLEALSRDLAEFEAKGGGPFDSQSAAIKEQIDLYKKAAEDLRYWKEEIADMPDFSGQAAANPQFKLPTSADIDAIGQAHAEFASVVSQLNNAQPVDYGSIVDFDKVLIQYEQVTDKLKEFIAEEKKLLDVQTQAKDPAAGATSQAIASLEQQLQSIDGTFDKIVKQYNDYVDAVMEGKKKVEGAVPFMGTASPESAAAPTAAPIAAPTAAPVPTDSESIAQVQALQAAYTALMQIIQPLIAQYQALVTQSTALATTNQALVTSFEGEVQVSTSLTAALQQISTTTQTLVSQDTALVAIQQQVVTAFQNTATAGQQVVAVNQQLVASISQLGAQVGQINALSTAYGNLARAIASVRGGSISAPSMPAGPSMPSVQPASTGGSFSSSAGSDTLSGGSGVDTLSGGAGSDTLSKAATDVSALAVAYQTAAVAQQQFNTSMQSINMSTNTATDSVEGLKTSTLGLDTAVPAVQRLEGAFKEMSSIAENAITSLADTIIDDLVHEGKINLENLRKTMLDVAADILKQMFKLMISGLLGGGGAMGGGGAGIFGALFGGGARTGAAFDGPITKMRTGGIISHPSMFATSAGMVKAGEAGSEAILPLGRDSTGRLGVVNHGGGGRGVVANINITAADSREVAINKAIVGTALMKVLRKAGEYS
jgi:tape measure domain-containing protein